MNSDVFSRSYDIKILWPTLWLIFKCTRKLTATIDLKQIASKNLNHQNVARKRCHQVGSKFNSSFIFKVNVRFILHCFKVEKKQTYKTQSSYKPYHDFLLWIPIWIKISNRTIIKHIRRQTTFDKTKGNWRSTKSQFLSSVEFNKH